MRISEHFLTRKLSFGGVGRFSPGRWHCGGRLARLHFRRGVEPLHHASAGATWIDPALHLARRENLNFTPAVARFTLPPLSVLKSHERCPFFAARASTTEGGCVASQCDCDSFCAGASYWVWRRRSGCNREQENAAVAAGACVSHPLLYQTMRSAAWNLGKCS